MINYVHIYVNGKMIHVETIPGIRRRWDKGEWQREVNVSMT
jgi:hypothetical protein